MSIPTITVGVGGTTREALPVMLTAIGPDFEPVALQADENGHLVLSGGSADLAKTPAWSSTVTALVGGGSSALDGTTGVTDASSIFTEGRLVSILTSSGLKWVVLKAGTEATDGVSFVRPVNYHPSTFPYVFNIVG
jgi:hypothetical protein